MIEIPKKEGDSYFPNNPEGKISVKYYLNKDLKPKISESGEALYQLYYKVTVKKQATKGKSLAKDSLMSAKIFDKIEKVINSQSIEEMSERIYKLHKSGDFNFQDEHNKSNEMEYSFWDEKRLLLKIVDRLNPFNRKEFDIKEVIENYELFNIKIGDGVNKRLNVLIKGILKKQADTDLISGIYVKSIDWRKSNAYDLWTIFKDIFPDVHPLVNKYNRCFQIITLSQNIFSISEKEDNIMQFIAFNTYVELKNHISWREPYEDEIMQKEYELFDSIVFEIEKLFFG